MTTPIPPTTPPRRWLRCRALVQWARQKWCSHVCYLESMKRVDGMIHCRCNRCGKNVVALYGLALGCTWEKLPTGNCPICTKPWDECNAVKACRETTINAMEFQNDTQATEATELAGAGCAAPHASAFEKIIRCAYEICEGNKDQVIVYLVGCLAAIDRELYGDSFPTSYVPDRVITIRSIKKLNHV